MDVDSRIKIILTYTQMVASACLGLFFWTQTQMPLRDAHYPSQVRHGRGQIPEGLNGHVFVCECHVNEGL